jgi:hypothetical protein
MGVPSAVLWRSCGNHGMEVGRPQLRLLFAGGVSVAPLELAWPISEEQQVCGGEKEGREGGRGGLRLSRSVDVRLEVSCDGVWGGRR